MVIWQYKSKQMLVVLQDPNNIITHRLLIACHKVLSNNDCHQTINNFEKLLVHEGAENALIIIALIFLVLHIQIKLTRLLENGALNTKFDTEERLYPGSSGLDWDEKGKIEKVIVTDKDNKDEEDLWEKNR